MMNSSSNNPLVTIITIVFNNVTTIRNAIQSVAYQDYDNIEHVVIDNCSNDGTLEAINELKDDISLIVSESDEGIYYALNKGIEIANGEIVGFLNSDDVLKNRNTITKIVNNLTLTNNEAVYGDLQYFSKKHPNRITRRWKSNTYSSHKFRQGWMPPHPTFYTYKKTYIKYGFFDVRYKISSDYDMMLRLLYEKKIKAKYISEILVKMQRGRASNQNFKSIMLKSKEDFLIMKKYDFSLLTLLNKTVRKFSQFIFRGK
jgi:glycosyltransferase